jgi:uncharacterized protein
MIAFIRFAAAVLLACVANTAWSEDIKPAVDPARIAAARQLMDVTGAAKQFDAVMPMMMQQFEPLFLRLAPGHEKEIKEVLAGLLSKFSERKSELFEKIAGLYSEKMTAEDMKDLAAFFSTGTGARFIQLQPVLVQGSMAIGQQWGQQLGREIDKEMREELAKRGIKI